MSEILQAGQHPDADQLNAFVEHTLPAHEQQQTLAHLANCPACRQIVALSLPPADESPVLQPAVRHRWFTRWHPAWAGIPAFAALILVILFVRNGERRVRQESVPAQVADARKPAAPLVESTPPEVARDGRAKRRQLPSVRKGNKELPPQRNRRRLLKRDKLRRAAAQTGSSAGPWVASQASHPGPHNHLRRAAGLEHPLRAPADQ